MVLRKLFEISKFREWSMIFLIVIGQVDLFGYKCARREPLFLNIKLARVLGERGHSKYLGNCDAILMFFFRVKVRR